TGGDERTAAALAGELVDAEAEHLRCGIEDAPGCDLAWLVRADEVAKDPLGQAARQRLAREAGVRRHPNEGALELPDVVGDVGGDVVEHLVGHLGALTFGLLAKDGEAGLELGRLDIGDQAPLEPGTQPNPEGGDGPWRTV